MPSEIKGKIQVLRSGSETMTAVLRASRVGEHPGSESILALGWAREAEGSGWSRVWEQDTCASLWETEIIIPGCCCKRQEREFPLGEHRGQEGFGAASRDIDPRCHLLLGPLNFQAQALKKPNEQTSHCRCCSAPGLVLCSGNACDQDPVLFTTCRRVRRSKKRSLM